MRSTLFFLALALSLIFSACAEPCAETVCEHGLCNSETDTCDCDPDWIGEDCSVQAALEIEGEWTDNWGSAHDISQTVWSTMGSDFFISQYSNVEAFLLAQNDSANEYNPDLWSRFDWFYDSDGELLYCQSTYDAVDEDAALAASADRADIDAGCGGFAWSVLTEG